MKTFRKELWFNVPSRRAFINIIPDMQQCIDESGISEGLVLVIAVTDGKLDLHAATYVFSGNQLIIDIKNVTLLMYELINWQQN